MMSSGPRPRRPRRPERRDEARDLVGVVLAVRVQREDGVPALVEREPEPRPERGALALVGDLADHPCPGGLRHRGGVVGRAVVDDEDRQVAARGLDDPPDPRPLLVARDQRQDPRRARALVHGHGTGSDGSAEAGAPEVANERLLHDACGSRDEVLDLVAVERVEVHHDRAAAGKVEQEQPEPLVAHHDPVVDGRAVEQGHGRDAVGERAGLRPVGLEADVELDAAQAADGRHRRGAHDEAGPPLDPGRQLGGAPADARLRRGRTRRVLRCGLRVAEQVDADGVVLDRPEVRVERSCPWPAPSPPGP